MKNFDMINKITMHIRVIASGKLSIHVKMTIYRGLTRKMNYPRAGYVIHQLEDDFK